MTDHFKQPLNNRCMLLLLLILIMGISTGIFFGDIIPVPDKQHFTALLQNCTPFNFSAVLINLSFLLLIITAGFTVYGFPLVIIILFSHSFAVGFCDCLLLYKLEPSGIPDFIFSFFLPQLILCGVYFIFSAFSISYALSKF
jgi:hypothetical protein